MFDESKIKRVEWVPKYPVYRVAYSESLAFSESIDYAGINREQEDRAKEQLIEMIYKEQGWQKVERNSKLAALILKAVQMNIVQCAVSFTRYYIWVQEPSIIAELRFKEEAINNHVLFV